MNKFIFTTFLLLSQSSFSQKMEKVLISNTDKFELYINDGESTNLYYYKMIPIKNITGVLVILPSGGESTENTLKQITIQERAINEGLLVIIPSINWGTNDKEEEFKMLDGIFKDVVNQYKISKNNFIFCGLSNGAIISLKYAEKSVETPNKYYLIPKGIIALDPPLDDARFYKYCEREIEKNFYEPAVNEAIWLKNNYDSLYGGSPDKFSDIYVKNSIYSFADKNGGNAVYLKEIPLLMFTDLDIDFLLNQRHRDLYDWNGIDIISMVNKLKTLGNTNANVIVSQGKGIRQNGSKNPHSWSILDTEKSINWITELLK